MDIYNYDNIGIEDLEVVECGDYTFEEFAKDFKEDITKEQKEQAEKLFEEAIKYEEKANEAWDKLYNMDIFDYTVKDIDFDIFMLEE